MQIDIKSLEDGKTGCSHCLRFILPGEETSIQQRGSADNQDVSTHRTDTIEEATTMFRPASLATRACRIALVLAIGPLVAGCASERSVRPQPDSTNVVQRPTYEVDRAKTLYLGGYAGANYESGVRPAR
jgi:hypothetical protein